ncbi:MAG: hypothetical protein Q9203_007165 [Teloschistes exilis]
MAMGLNNKDNFQRLGITTSGMRLGLNKYRANNQRNEPGGASGLVCSTKTKKATARASIGTVAKVHAVRMLR